MWACSKRCERWRPNSKNSHVMRPPLMRQRSCSSYDANSSCDRHLRLRSRPGRTRVFLLTSPWRAVPVPDEPARGLFVAGRLLQTTTTVTTMTSDTTPTQGWRARYRRRNVGATSPAGGASAVPRRRRLCCVDVSPTQAPQQPYGNDIRLCSPTQLRSGAAVKLAGRLPHNRTQGPQRPDPGRGRGMRESSEKIVMHVNCCGTTHVSPSNSWGQFSRLVEKAPCKGRDRPRQKKGCAGWIPLDSRQRSADHNCRCSHRIPRRVCRLRYRAASSPLGIRSVFGGNRACTRCFHVSCFERRLWSGTV